MANPDEEELDPVALEAADEPPEAADLDADEAALAALEEAPATAPLTEEEADERAEAPEALAADATEAAEAEAEDAAEAADPVKVLALPPAPEAVDEADAALAVADEQYEVP